jgi:hypothetical protein
VAVVGMGHMPGIAAAFKAQKAQPMAEVASQLALLNMVWADLMFVHAPVSSDPGHSVDAAAHVAGAACSCVWGSPCRRRGRGPGSSLVCGVPVA